MAESVDGTEPVPTATLDPERALPFLGRRGAPSPEGGYSAYFSGARADGLAFQAQDASPGFGCDVGLPNFPCAEGSGACVGSLQPPDEVTLTFAESMPSVNPSITSENEIMAVASSMNIAAHGRSSWPLSWRRPTGASHARGLQAPKRHWHSHAPLDPKKAWSIGSLSFSPIYTEQHNEDRLLHPRGKSKIFAAMATLLPLVIGLICALVAWQVGELTRFLGEQRTKRAQQWLREDKAFIAWVEHTGIICVLALAGSLPVILWSRTSGSSGIPAVIGLLNGCDLRSEFTWKSLVARMFGVTCAVASGLVAGPEGPMIFIGACIGALVSRIPSSVWVWKLFGRPPASLNAAVYLRDYVAIGSGCGIAAAFRAPIAGTLFVIEEAASHFHRRHLAKIFCGGLAALEVIVVATSGGGLLEYKVTTGPMCANWPGSRCWGIVWFIAVGLVCGLAGAVFNSLNIRLMLWRARHANASMPLRRALEILVICICTSSIFLILPCIFKDKGVVLKDILADSTGCLQESMQNQLIAGSWILEGTGPDELPKDKFIPKPCLYGFQFDRYTCKSVAAIRDDPREDPTVRMYASECADEWRHDIKLPPTVKDVWAYCCSFKTIDDLRAGKYQLPGNTSCPVDLMKDLTSLAQKDVSSDGLERYYNPMASLTMVPWAKTAQNLFIRGMPHLFPPLVLVVFFIAFFLLAAVTAGSAIPSGLLLPQLICGGLLGRLVTLAANYCLFSSIMGTFDISESIWAPSYSVFFSKDGPLGDAILTTPTGLADPGIGAVVGAAAFLGGSGRITLFTTVMMVEITGDPLLILPVGVATIVAVLIGNVFNHGLYHSLIDVQSFPFLPDMWPKGMPYLKVGDALPLGSRNIVTIPLAASVDQVRSALNNTYKGFPVVNDRGTAVGTAERAHLEEVLHEAEQYNLEWVDVGKATEPYPMMIRTRLPMVIAFDLFKRMEMRRLVVVDDFHIPVAVLTRRSLLPWVLEARLETRTSAPPGFLISRPSGFYSPAASPRT